MSEQRSPPRRRRPMLGLLQKQSSNEVTSSRRCSAHLSDGSRQGEKSLLLQQRLIHGGYIGIHKELIGFALGSLRLAQSEVMVCRPVVGDAGGGHEITAEEGARKKTRFKCNVTRNQPRHCPPPTRPEINQCHERQPHATSGRPTR